MARRNRNRNDRPDRSHRPSMNVGLGGNAEGYGRGGALDYGYGGMNVGGRDADWGLGDVPHGGATIGPSRIHDEERSEEWVRHHPRRSSMQGGGYGGAQGRGGRGYDMDPAGEIQGASYGRGWRNADAVQTANELARGARDNTGRGPRGYRRSDVRITEDVCDAMTDDAVLDASGIDVRVDDCEVTLSGTVDDRTMKRRAEDIAASVRGVVDVHNQLRIGHAERAD